MKKCYFLFSFLTIIISAGLAVPLPAQQRLNTPDGELVFRKSVVTYNNVQYRLAATYQTLYLSKYSGTSGWSKAIPLYMTLPGRRITDLTLAPGENNAKRTVYLLIDDGSLYKMTINLTTSSVEGKPSYEPGMNLSGLTKILAGSNKVFLGSGGTGSSRFYCNLIDGKGWINDTIGLNHNSIADFSIDKNGDIIAATNKGLFTLLKDSVNWQRFSGFDTSLRCEKIFINRNGNIYVSSVIGNSRILMLSSDNGNSWIKDTAGLGTATSYRFGDDAYGTTYMTTSSMLYRKAEGSISWERVDTNLSKIVQSTFVFYDIGGDSTLEAATTYGIYTSKDKGTTWTASYSGIMSEEIYGLQFLDEERIIVSTRFGIFTQESPTSGWMKKYPANGYSTSRPLFKAGDRYIYTQEPSSGPSTHQPYVLVTTDAGTTWSYDTLGISKVPVSPGYGTPSVFFVDRQGGQHYGIASFSSNPLRIYNKPFSASWDIDTNEANLKVPTQGKASYPSAFGLDGSGNFYFCLYNYSGSLSTIEGFIYKRQYTGNVWYPDTAGIGSDVVSSMIRNKQGKMFAGTYIKGSISSIYYKKDTVWEKIPVPPASATDVYSMAVDSNGILYANFTPSLNSGSYKGVYLTGDMGITWLYGGMDSINVRGLVARDTAMYAYTNRGVYKLAKIPFKLPQITLALKNIDFKQVSKNNSKDTTVQITNTGTDTLRISGIASNNTVFTSVTKTLNIAPGSSSAITLRFIPNKNGIVKATFKINSNAYPDSILVTGEGINFTSPVMVLSQKQIDFGTVQGGHIKDTSIIIRNTGQDTLRLSNIRSTNGAFKVGALTNPNISPGDSEKVYISFTPVQDGKQNGIIRFSGNVDEDTLYVTGTGENSLRPVIQFSASTLDFDSVEVGKSKDMNLQVISTGTDTLKVTNIISSNPVFTVSNKTFNLKPRDTAAITIKFTPNSLQPTTSKVRFLSNAPVDSITAKGKGILPSSVEELTENLQFEISPNPVTSQGTIHFVLPEDKHISIVLFDELGNEAALIANDDFIKGEYSILINIQERPFDYLSNGTYFCRFVSKTFDLTKSIVIYK